MQHLGETYRTKALELCARANKQSDFYIQAEYESLAFLYMELADRVDFHEHGDKETAWLAGSREQCRKFPADGR